MSHWHGFIVAYKKKDLERLALKAIENDQTIVFECDIVQCLPCSRATYYNHGLDKLDTIKEALDRNKSAIKQSLRKKWYDSDNATVQIALYKLIGSDEETEKLNGSKQKIEHSGELTTNIRTFSEAAKKIYEP